MGTAIRISSISSGAVVAGVAAVCLCAIYACSSSEPSTGSGTSSSSSSSGGSSGGSSSSGSTGTSGGSSSGGSIGNPADFCSTVPTKVFSKCGWNIDTGETACTKCLDNKCCDESIGCTANCPCAMCTFEVAKGDPSCIEGVLDAYKTIADCKATKCELECATGSSTSSGGSGNACSSTSCPPSGGDAVCKNAGCGTCALGKCTTF